MSVQEESQSSIHAVHTTEDTTDDLSLDALDENIDTVAQNKECNDLSNSETDEETSNQQLNNVESVIDTTGKDVVTHKPNRELKSILALSKEANLNTNIIHKRKSVEHGKINETLNSDCKGRISLSLTPEIAKSDKKIVKEFQSKQLKTGAGSSSSDIESSNISDSEDSIKEKDGSNKPYKVKSENWNDVNEGSTTDEHELNNRKLLNNLPLMMDNKIKDAFCWRCHNINVTTFCETCPRSYHGKCIRQTISQPNHWLCPECVGVLKAENLKQRSPAMRELTLEHLCGLLKFALKRMMQVSGCEPFIHPVNETEFPDYKKYIVQPMDLTRLEKNIKENVYGSTQAFESDAKWILHNSIVFNSYQSKLTSIAKGILKICRQEMSEIENCANCYLNANTKKKTWFVEVCPKPHLLVWAKLKGFPYWPAKAMRSNNSGMVDVRFFGAHDRAWIAYKECYLFSEKEPNSNRQKRNDIKESLKELKIHVENLKNVFLDFSYAPYKTLYNPDKESEQLQLMLPKFTTKARNSTKASKNNKLNSNGNVSSSHLETVSEKSDSESDDPEANSLQSSKSLEDTENPESEDSSEDDDTSAETIADSGINNSLDQLNDSKNSEITKQHTNFQEKNEEKMVVGTHIVRCGKVRMRGGHTNTSGKIKVIPKISPENIRKRSSSSEYETPIKVMRRNSDQSIKSDSSRLSNISKVDISENMEIVLENDSGNISISESITTDDVMKIELPDITLEAKRKPVVQVNLGVNENAEFSISPQSKSKIADRLMKKLNETESEPSINSSEVTELNIEENAEKYISSTTQNTSETDLLLKKLKNKDVTVLEKITELSPDIEIFETNTKSEVTKKSDSETDIADYKEQNDRPMTKKEIDTVIGKSLKEYDELENILEETNQLIQRNSKEHHAVQDSTKAVQKQENSQISELNKQNKEPTITRSEVVINNTITPIKKKKPSVAVQNKRDSVDKDIEDKIEKKVSVASKAEENKESKKRKRSCDSVQIDDVIEVNPFEKKLVKVVNIEDIKNKDLNENSNSTREKMLKSLPENCLKSIQIIDVRSGKDASSKLSAQDDDLDIDDAITIKSELSSDEEVNENEYMELKRKYMSALNISERVQNKPKQKDISKHSQTEGVTFKVVDNLSKVIDDVAKRYSLDHAHDEITLTPVSKKKEVFIKPITKMPKARKSFPSPVVRNTYSGLKKDLIKVSKSIAVSSIFSSPKPSTVSKLSDNNGGKIIGQLTVNSNSLPPNQPITFSANTSSSMLTMVPHPLGNVHVQQVTSTSTASNFSGNRREIPIPSGDIPESQNIIPQIKATSKSSSINIISKSTITSTTTTTNSQALVASIPILTSTASPISVNNIGNLEKSVIQHNIDVEEIKEISSGVPERVLINIAEIMNHGPPKLRPRPPGPLSIQLDQGLPSSAGVVTSQINSISHRINDYFRCMLIELLQDMGNSQIPEAEITRLKLENEELKHRHAEEILEIKKNVSTVLKDIQKSMLEEQQRLIEETRTMCEAETLKRVEDAKSKQWCANCSKEAQFYCCWNTSYCDYPCQQKHWPKHMSKCTQNLQKTQQLQSSASINNKVQSQSFVLRQSVPSKNLNKSLLAKPTKVYISRPSSSKSSQMSTPPGNHLTLVESTPGNFELAGNGGPISVGGKFVSSIGKIKGGSIISVTSPTSSTTVSSSGQKHVYNKQNLSAKPTTSNEDFE